MEKSAHSKEYGLLRRHLRDARLRAGLTHRALAELLDVPHTWIGKVENGERRIDVIETVRFAAACGVEAAQFFDQLLSAIAKEDGTPRKAKPSRRAAGRSGRGT